MLMNYTCLQRVLINSASLDQLKRIHALCVTLGLTIHTQSPTTLGMQVASKLQECWKNRTRTKGLRPDSFLAVAALSCCGHCKDLVRGSVIHGMVFRNRMDETPVVSSALIDMYCRNGMIGVATLVFEKMGIKDVFCWISWFNGSIVCNNLSYACQMFDAMPERNEISWTAMSL